MPVRCLLRYFNSHTLRGVRPPELMADAEWLIISTHAPREGCDARDVCRPGSQTISTHAPREGCDPSTKGTTSRGSGFQLTHPARGATHDKTGHQLRHVISTHAPREGCDVLADGVAAACPKFQLTHPARGATFPLTRHFCFDVISTHAPREGCDFSRRFSGISLYIISTHAPREGCDPRMDQGRKNGSDFNSRTPRGVRLRSHRADGLESAISTHAPREGCDDFYRRYYAQYMIFQLTHPARGATRYQFRPAPGPPYFNSRTPRGVRLAFIFYIIGIYKFQLTHPARGATSANHHDVLS